jgi:hypothetical protein
MQKHLFLLWLLLPAAYAGAQVQQSVFVQGGICDGLYFGALGAPCYGIGYTRSLKPKWSLAADYTYSASSTTLAYRTVQSGLGSEYYSPTESSHSLAANIRYDILKAHPKSQAKLGLGISVFQNKIAYYSDFVTYYGGSNTMGKTDITPTENTAVRVMANFSAQYDYRFTPHIMVGLYYTARLVNTQYLAVTTRYIGANNSPITENSSTQYIGRVGTSHLLLRVGYLF